MINLLTSIFLITSTIVGLGVFILPYTLAHSGIYFWFWFLIIPILIFYVHLAYSEIIFQIEEKHNLPGLSEKILGKNWKNIVWLIDFLGTLFVFASYYLALAKFTNLIFPFNNELLIRLFYAFLVIIIILFSVNPFSKTESILAFFMILLFLILGIYFLPQISLNNFQIEFLNPWLAYGILIFAYTGYSSLQMVYDIIGKNKKVMFWINLISILLVTFLYLLFVFSIYGTFGKNVSSTTLENLKGFANPYIVKIVSFLAILNILTTFIALAFYLKRGLIFDYKINSTLSWLIISLVIFLIPFLKLENIAKLISLTGSIFLGFNLFVLLLCYLKLKNYIYFKIPKILVIILLILLGFGWFIGILTEIMGG